MFHIRKSTTQFILEAKNTHGDKYDYSKVEYTTNKDKVCIICPIHGEFRLLTDVPNVNMREQRLSYMV